MLSVGQLPAAPLARARRTGIVARSTTGASMLTIKILSGSTADYCGSGCQSAFGRCTDTAPVAAPVSQDGTCGDVSPFWGQTCLNSPYGNCCSGYGFCGSTDAYCNPTTCNSKYGACSAAPSPSPITANLNRVANPSFEQGVDSWPDQSSNGARGDASTVDPHTGKYSYQINGNGSNTKYGGWGYNLQQQILDLPPQTNHVFSIWAKSTVASGCQVTLQIWQPAGNHPEDGFSGTFGIDTEYKLYSFEHLTPRPGRNMFTVVVTCNGRGASTIWIDDISVMAK
ncbi:hypothetical protein PspLS_11299 [Pyricularia sp. CBS 133598]|nr:hypothetical protein PspLS_11299 [Pyricularia sp. CBS 133598]